MRLAVDFNNTITDNPEFFSRMCSVVDLHIVSGTPEAERQLVVDYLKKHNIEYSGLYLCPFTWTNPEEYHKSKEWKLKTIAKLKPALYFDDSMREVLAVQKKTKACGLLMIKPTYRKWMKR